MPDSNFLVFASFLTYFTAVVNFHVPCEELDKKRKLVAPRVLGIDESHIGHKMRGVFTDIEGGPSP